MTRTETADAMESYGDDIFTEPDADPDGLANLGPLRAIAGIWESVRGVDEHPIGPGSDTDGVAIEGGLRNEYVERYDLQPIDPQTNGPQLIVPRAWSRRARCQSPADAARRQSFTVKVLQQIDDGRRP